MASVQWSFWILGFFGIATGLYGSIRYRTLLNPLTVFAVTQIGLFTLVSAIVAIHMIAEVPYDPDAVVDTVILALIYLGATTVPYFFSGTLPERAFGTFLAVLRLDSESLATRFSVLKWIFLLSGAAATFAALAVFGGGGMRWLTHTRDAYIGYRAGVGPLFAATQWLLTFALLYLLWASRPTAFRLLYYLLFFSVLMNFLGSKNNILTLFVIGLFYYNFYVHRIAFAAVIFIGLTMAAMILALLVLQNSYASLFESPLYFRDYFDTTAHFISRFDEFGYLYGQGLLSSLWFYVPRAFCPDKPYEYGVTLIHKVLYPGAAELGHTPGILPWSLAYLDFGAAGVAAYGLGIGLWQRMAYEFFLKNKRKFFAFAFAMQFSIWPIWTFAPVIIIVLWSIAQSLFLRTVWRRKKRIILPPVHAYE